jgi:hypothetical protein
MTSHSVTSDAMEMHQEWWKMMENSCCPSNYLTVIYAVYWPTQKSDRMASPMPTIMRATLQDKSWSSTHHLIVCDVQVYHDEKPVPPAGRSFRVCLPNFFVCRWAQSNGWHIKCRTGAILRLDQTAWPRQDWAWLFCHWCPKRSSQRWVVANNPAVGWSQGGDAQVYYVL